MTISKSYSNKLIQIVATLVLFSVVTPSIAQNALQEAINGDHRSAENRARDIYRKPAEVLDFLGFRDDMTVVEVWPGGGWYTEILAPALKENGTFYAAAFEINGRHNWERRSTGRLLEKLGDNPDQYSEVIVTEFGFPYSLDIAPAESADMVLTFRNVHNWVADYYDSGRYIDVAFSAMYRALKPGGILGIVDHQWDDASNEDPNASNGYLSVERTVAWAEAAGFELVEESQLLHNPADTKDHPEGVWTLPPGYALGDEDRQKYEAIGESDRYLLKFRKPL